MVNRDKSIDVLLGERGVPGDRAVRLREMKRLIGGVVGGITLDLDGGTASVAPDGSIEIEGGGA